MLGYISCEQCKAAENLKQSLKNTPLEEGKKRELISAIHGHFREWLFGILNTNWLYLYLWHISPLLIQFDVCANEEPVWVAASGNIRQIYDLQALDRLDSNGME